MDGCWFVQNLVFSSRDKDMHNPLPSSLSSNCGIPSFVVPQTSAGLGSKSSRGFSARFLCLPYSCFWKVASENGRLFPYAFLGLSTGKRRR